MSFPTIDQLQAQFAASTDAVYFASADKKSQYYGFGKQASFSGHDTVALKKWLQQQKNPVFGGLPFDNQMAKGALMNGYFVAPNVVYEVVQQEQWGTIINTWPKMTQGRQATVTAQQDDVTWINRITTAINTMQTDASKQKVVLGRQRQLTLSKSLDLGQLLIDLNKQQPHSYHFVLKHAGEVFVSATPERIVQVQGTAFATAGVAGTIRRGATPTEDKILATELLNDDKNRLEHAYVVNTIAERLVGIVDVVLPSGPVIMKNPQVQHLYTPISGQLIGATSLLDLVLRLHPTPALGGKPLDWAMATIARLETDVRGLFAAPIGIQLPNGDGEFVVGIRAMHVHGNHAQLFAGAGILADSDAEQEFNETGLKMTPMMNLLRG